MPNIVLKAPAGIGPLAFMNLRDGTTVQMDLNGYVTVDAKFTSDLLSAGFSLTQADISDNES